MKSETSFRVFAKAPKKADGDLPFQGYQIRADGDLFRDPRQGNTRLWYLPRRWFHALPLRLDKNPPNHLKFPSQPITPAPPQTSARPRRSLSSELVFIFIGMHTHPRGRARSTGTRGGDRVAERRPEVPPDQTITRSYGTEPGGGRPHASDLMPRRVGSNPPAALCQLRHEVEASIYAACWIPYALVGEKGDGTARREAYRAFILHSVEPLGKTIADELGRVLETDVRFRFTDLRAADFQGRARAYKSLVDSDMEPGGPGSTCRRSR